MSRTIINAQKSGHLFVPKKNNSICVMDATDGVYISFDIVIQSWPDDVYSSILHISNKDDLHLPAIFLTPKNSIGQKIHFTYSHENDNNPWFNSVHLKTGISYNVKLWANTSSLLVKLDGDVVKAQTKLPKHIKQNNVNVYVGNPWYKPADCLITDLVIKTYKNNEMDDEKKEVEYVAKWSSKYKGSNIKLSENDTKATINPGYDNMVRALHPVSKGMIVELKFIWYVSDCWCDDYLGVISSAVKLATPCQKIVKSKLSAYCMRFTKRNIHHFGLSGEINLGWGIVDKIEKKQATEIGMKIDYSTNAFCVISFSHNGKELGSMKLPRLESHHAWYPVASLDKPETSCNILCV